MAEEIYFIKPNPTIAKINLANKLCSEENTVLNFLDEDREANLEIIKNKVNDSIENLNPEEFRSILHWFESECKARNPENKEELINQLYIHGIDQFYDIPPLNVQRFNQILSDYQDYSQNTLPYKFNAENFSPFLIYGIFFTGLIHQLHEKKDSDIVFMDFLKAEHPALYSFAKEEFDSNLNHSASGFTEYSESTLYHYFTELYDLTRFYKGSIIKLDDY